MVFLFKNCVLFSLVLALFALLTTPYSLVYAVSEEASTSTIHEATPANYNNVRSNRSSIAAPDTNVCDGVTCADGSCAPTTYQCLAGAVADELDIEMAPVDQLAGEILKTHVCPIHGYKLTIARPAGYPTNASERVIQVEKIAQSFNAVWSEVSALINSYQPDDLDYYELPNNPGPDGKRYCQRSGRFIPIDTDVYQVSVVHSNNYNGNTTIFADNNLELAPLSTVISTYNQKRDQGDALPPTCNYGCLDGNDGVVSDDKGDAVRPTDTVITTGDMLGEIGATNPGVSDSNPATGDQAGEREPGVQYPYELEEVADDADDRAQSYNSLRSNRTESVAIDWFDEDDDNDQSTVVWRAGQFEETEGQTNSGDTSAKDWVKCWGAGEVSSGKMYTWGDGVCLAIEETVAQSATGTNRVAALQVTGDQIRGWTGEQRTAWQEFRLNSGTSSLTTVLTEQMITHTQQDGRIKEIRIATSESEEAATHNYTPIKISYQAQLNLFGFIPIERVVQAENDAAGEVKIAYPWYSFLASKPSTKNITDLFTSLTTTLDPA